MPALLREHARNLIYHGRRIKCNLSAKIIPILEYRGNAAEIDHVYIKVEGEEEREGEREWKGKPCRLLVSSSKNDALLNI